MTETALIWDLDGTLLDSYGIIVPSLQETLAEFQIDTEAETLLRRVTETSVSAVIREAAEKTGRSFAEIKDRYSAVSGGRALEIPPMPRARETLEALAAMGALQFVYTHRGSTTAPVLEHLGFQRFFKEVVTSLRGFPRKPSPDALLYLMERYGLDKSRTFYIGDRTLDLDCARNAGIPGVLYAPSGAGTADYVVRDLMEIQDIVRDASGKERT